MSRKGRRETKGKWRGVRDGKGEGEERSG